MTAPLDLSDDERDIVDNAALAMESFERHNKPGDKQCQCHPCRSFDSNKSVIIADFAKRLSDARAALRTIEEAIHEGKCGYPNWCSGCVAKETLRAVKP